MVVEQGQVPGFIEYRPSWIRLILHIQLKWAGVHVSGYRSFNPGNTDLPRHCTFRESDWHILAGFWHPVAFVHDIKDKPVAARLLDVNLVIYRTSEGITVAKDLCMHRGTRLSLGWMQDDLLVLPHAWFAL